MRSRPVEIVICLETSATLNSLRGRYYAAICDALTRNGEEGKIVRVHVFVRPKARAPEGGAM